MLKLRISLMWCLALHLFKSVISLTNLATASLESNIQLKLLPILHQAWLLKSLLMVFNTFQMFQLQNHVSISSQQMLLQKLTILEITSPPIKTSKLIFLMKLSSPLYKVPKPKIKAKVPKLMQRGSRVFSSIKAQNQIQQAWVSSARSTTRATTIQHQQQQLATIICSTPRMRNPRSRIQYLIRNIFIVVLQVHWRPESDISHGSGCCSGRNQSLAAPGQYSSPNTIRWPSSQATSCFQSQSILYTADTKRWGDEKYSYFQCAWWLNI